MRDCRVEQKVDLEVGGKALQVTHIDKLLFPASHFTKAQVIDYYIRISRFILPHLRDRPLTLKLYLNGISEKPEYIKNAPAYTPKWIRRSAVWRKSGASQIHYVLINDLPSLVWAANLNNIEMHTFLAKASAVQRPLMMVLDLDPGEPATILDCAHVALWLKEGLERLKLQACLKSSGSKGLHVCVPLNTAVSYDQTQALAQGLALWLERMHPEVVVTEMAKAVRSGKVFVDYGQNASFKSTAVVYSLRARADGPFVSSPLSWAELKMALDKADPERFFIRPAEAVRQCERSGDAFADVIKTRQSLPRDIDTMLIKLAAPPRRVPTRGSAATQLTRYQEKRNFTRTREPAGLVQKSARAGGAGSAGSAARNRLFVIQKHAASHLHYDFRLEMQGVLRSWAVPKGPPYQRGERRLAMLVEDHPLEYARFEGTIPKGEYGGGTVMVWDMGTYEVTSNNPAQDFHSGKLHLFLRGKKLKGEWTLVRSRPDERGRESWFLIKTGADTRPVGTRRDDQSALTRRTMAQIAQQNTAQWSSNR